MSLQTVGSARYPCRVQGTQSTYLRTEIIVIVKVERKSRTRTKLKLVKNTRKRQHAGNGVHIRSHSKAERAVLVIQFTLSHKQNFDQTLPFDRPVEVATKR